MTNKNPNVQQKKEKEVETKRMLFGGYFKGIYVSNVTEDSINAIKLQRGG